MKVTTGILNILNIYHIHINKALKFWISTKYTYFSILISSFFYSRSMDDAVELFSVAKAKSRIRPKVIRTDKQGIYHGAFKKVFYSHFKERCIKHLTSCGFHSPTNINLIEHFHSTIKQRYKVMRGLKESYSASVVLDGFVMHYTFFFEHSYVNYVTSADMAGVGESIRNWGNLIELVQGNFQP